MNNSKIALDNVFLSLEEVDNTEQARERESRLVRIIEAIERVKSSDDWSTLKSLIFDSSVEILEKRLRSEAEALRINDSEVYRLQGQLVWARRYADLDKLAGVYRAELSNLRKTYE